MAIVTSTITGRVLLPNDTAYTDGVLSFQLSETDVESEAVMPTGKLSVTLDGDDIPAGFTLWRNTRGLRGTTYAVTLAATVTTEVGGGRTFTQRKNFSLGNCQVGSESTYTIGALLGNPVGDPADWARQVRYFDTRANFVTWAGANDPYVGQVIFTEGVSYRFIDSGTAIGDLPGWVIQEAGTTSIADSAVTTAKIADSAVTTAKINANAVTNAKLATMATARIKGRTTSGTGDPEDLTATQTKALLAIAGSDVSMSGGGTAAEYTGFSTRAAFVSWASGKTPAVGTVITAAGYAYRYIGSGTSISDLAGWVPDDRINVMHWGVDSTGATNDATKLNAAFVYGQGKDIYFPPGTFAFTGYVAGINTNGTNVIGAGIGRTILNMSVSSTSYTAAFGWSASRCTWSGFTFNFSTLAGSSSVFANTYSGSNNTFERIRWVGGVTGYATPSHNVYPFVLSTSTDVTGTTFRDCEEESLSYGFLKGHGNTRTTKDIRILNHSAKNCFKSGSHNIDNPSGVLQDVTMDGAYFNQDASRGLYPLAIAIASGDNINISNIRASGYFAEVIHIEENVKILNISNCVGRLSSGHFITFTSNNIGGTWYKPEQISITNVQAEQVVSQTGTGLYMSFDEQPISSGTNLVASNGVFKNFNKGIEIGTRGEDNVRVSNFQLVNCNIGAYYTGDSTLDIKDFTFSGCTTAIQVNRGGVAENCTFYDNTNTHSVTAGVLQLLHPKFNFGLEAITGGTSRWFRLIKRVTRAQSIVNVRAYASSANKVDMAYQVNWDGTTETVTLLNQVATGVVSGLVAMVDEASAVTISAGGTGYTVGDVLTVDGGTLETSGTRTTATVATVSSGVVTGVTITNVGEWATPPVGAAATTGGTGSGCTLTLTTVKAICTRIFASSDQTVSITSNVDGSVYVV